MTALVAQLSVGLHAGKLHACLGVDIQCAFGAPGGECLRIDYGADHPQSLTALLAFESLGLLLPFAMGGRKDVTVCHDAENFRIVVFAVPSDTQNLDLRHILPPEDVNRRSSSRESFGAATSCTSARVRVSAGADCPSAVAPLPVPP